MSERLRGGQFRVQVALHRILLSPSQLYAVVSLFFLIPQWGLKMKYKALVAAILASIMLGGCFSSVISNYEIPNDLTSKQCKLAPDCTDNGGGGGAG